MYTLFIDESGDQGLEVVRNEINKYGASPYLCFGGVLVPNKNLDSVREVLRCISIELKNKELHCVDLNHFETSYFARTICKQQILLFGVISKKSTLGGYKELIEGKNQAADYYNKCSQYLLERVGHFMSEKRIESDKVSIVFEEKNHDYQRLRNFIGTVRKSPHDSRANYLQRIDPLSIRSETKAKEILLSIADLVAFSLRQSVDASSKNFGVPEQRYFRELKEKFWLSSDGSIANYGLKYIKGPISIGLKDKDLKFALKMYPKKKK